MANESKLRIAVIGGGPGGYVAAIRAAQLGAQVTLIEKWKLGGTCLNVGCIPTKSLLYSAELLDTLREAHKLGVAADNIRVDWPQVQAKKDRTSMTLIKGVQGLLKRNGITQITGEARFVSRNTLCIKTAEGEKTLEADRIIIASGSVPAISQIPGAADAAACIDSTAALQLEQVPSSMLVLGADGIGVELAGAYASFGARVTVVEAGNQVIPSMDGEMAALLQRQLEKKGVKFFLHTQAVSVEHAETGARVRVRSGETEQILEAEKVLISAGRMPNTAGLSLENAGIACQDGGIPVNEHMETNVPGIYAIGDCVGKTMLAHAASAMGEVAAEHAMGQASVFSGNVCPSCIYGNPELAWVGLTEEEAKAQDPDCRVGKFSMGANGRSMILGSREGMIKVIADSRFGEILGVHIFAPRATDLIGEAVLAMELEATTDELIAAIHAHPTVSEALREAAMHAEKRAIHTKN